MSEIPVDIVRLGIQATIKELKLSDRVNYSLEVGKKSIEEAYEMHFKEKIKEEDLKKVIDFIKGKLKEGGVEVMEKIYKTGDVVRLKAGGELMTVKEYRMLMDIETGEYSEDKEYDIIVYQWLEVTKLLSVELSVTMVEKIA